MTFDVDSEKLVWIDVEADDVDERFGNILQVACLVTDTDLNILDENGYEAVFYHSFGDVGMMKTNAHPVVLDMHTTTGLWNRVPREGKEASLIDKQLLAYIKQFAPHEKQSYLGGNSITLDRNYLRKFVPQTFNHISYRSLDVTGLWKAAQIWGGDNSSAGGHVEHEALADIRRSIEMARKFKERYFQ